MAGWAKLAEDSGWDGLFVEDYLVYQGEPATPTFDPWVALAAMAMATQRVMLGTMVTPLPRRRPWKVAAEAIALDHLSGGRLIFGAGAGDVNDPGFTAVGEQTDMRSRAELLDESLGIVAALWSGQRVQLSSAHFRVDGLTLSPTPLQHPRIPIWVGGDLLVPKVRQRMARWDGCCPYKGPPGGDWTDVGPEEVREILDLVEGAERSRAFDISLGGRERAADLGKEREHIQSVAEAGATWWTEWVKPTGPEATRRAIERGPVTID